MKKKAKAKAVRQPCATCAFRDGEAWVADKRMYFKVLECAVTNPGKPFYCHQGMPLDDNEYIPPTLPDGSADESKLSLCGGMVRFKQSLRGLDQRTRRRRVREIQKQMLEQFMDVNPWGEGLKAAGVSADDLAGATLMLCLSRDDEETPC